MLNIRDRYHVVVLGVVLAFIVLPIAVIGSGARDPSLITARLLGDISELDPGNIRSMHDMFVATNVYASLVRFIPGTGNTEPDLATAWEISENGLEWTFHLRDGLVFHKGYGPVTADDVKFSLERIIENGMRQASYLEQVEEVQVIDETTVLIRLSAYDSAFLSKLAYRPGLIVSRKAVEEMGADFSLNPIGCGPYVFDSWLPGESVTLKVFEDYYGEKPAIDTIVFKIITDETAAAFAVEAGELDIAVIRSQETIDQFRDKPNFTMDIAPGTSVRMIVLNTSRPPFDNQLVRRAIAHAFDRDTLQAVLGDTVTVTDGQLFTPAFVAYTPDVALYEYDPSKAKELLADAGYGDGFDLPITSTQLAPWPDIMPVLEANLRAIGIRATTTFLEHSAFYAWQDAGDYELTVTPLGRPPHPDFLLSLAFHSSRYPPGSNTSFYNRIDSLIEAGRTESYDDLRTQIYEIIQKKLSYELPVIPVGYQNVVGVMQSDVKGYQPGILNGFWGRLLYFGD